MLLILIYVYWTRLCTAAHRTATTAADAARDFLVDSVSFLGHTLLDSTVLGTIIIIWLFTRFPQIISGRWNIHSPRWIARPPAPAPAPTATPTPTPPTSPQPPPTTPPPSSPTPKPSQPRKGSLSPDDELGLSDREILSSDPCFFKKRKPASKPVSKPVDKPVVKPVSKSEDKPVEKPVSKPASEPARMPMSIPTNLPLGKPTSASRPVPKLVVKPPPNKSKAELSKAIDDVEREIKLRLDLEKRVKQKDGKIEDLEIKLSQLQQVIESLQNQLAADQAAVTDSSSDDRPGGGSGPSSGPHKYADAQTSTCKQLLPKDELSVGEVAIERQKREAAEQKAKALEEALKEALEREKDLANKHRLENDTALEKILEQKDAQIHKLNSRLNSKDAELVTSQQTASRNEQVAREANSCLERQTAELNAAVPANHALKAEAAETIKEKQVAEASKTALKKELLESENVRMTIELASKALVKENESLKKRAEDSERREEAIARDHQQNLSRDAQRIAQFQSTIASAEATEGERMQAVNNLVQQLQETQGALQYAEQKAARFEAERNDFQMKGQYIESQLLAKSQLSQEMESLETGPTVSRQAPARINEENVKLRAELHRSSLEIQKLSQEPQRLNQLLADSRLSCDDVRRDRDQLQAKIKGGYYESLEKQVNVLRHQNEATSGRIQDLEQQNAELRAMGQRAVREAVREAVERKDEEIRKIRAEPQGTNNNGAPQTPFRTPANMINRSTPSSIKSSDSGLFSSGPRNQRLSPATQNQATALMANQQAALQQQIEFLNRQVLEYAKNSKILEDERDNAVDQLQSQAKDYQCTIDALIRERDAMKRRLDAALKREASALEDRDRLLDHVEQLNETIELYDESIKVDGEEDAEKNEQIKELGLKVQTQSLLIGAHQAIHNHTKSMGLLEERTKRIGSENLSREDQLKRPKNRPQDLFQGDFPMGYTRMETSGAGLLCGLRAIVNSIAAQHPSFPKSRWKPFKQ